MSGPLPAAPAAPVPRVQTFCAAVARRRQRPTPVLPPLIAAPLIGVLTLLIGFTLAARQSGGPRAPIEPPRLTHGDAFASSWPMLAIGSERDALLDGFPVRAGTIPDRQQLHGAKAVSVLADRSIAVEKLAGWLTVLHHLGVSRVQLVVENPRGERRAVDAQLVDGSHKALSCAKGRSPYGLLIDDHRVLLEQDPRATLHLEPGCLTLSPRW